MAEKNLRAAVCELLLRCEAAGQYSNIALDTALKRGNFESADRGLFTALFYGVTEHRLTLDHIIDTHSNLPASKIESRVRAALRLGLCQLLYFDRIPDHAAINESVSLVPSRSRGFVNAILRGFLRADKQISLPDKTVEPARYLSLCYSISEELAEAFLRIWGLNGAEKQLIAFSRVPDVTVRVNTKKLSRDEWLEHWGGTPTRYAPHGVKLTDGATLQKALSKGLCFVQDEASQICVAALDARGHKVLDLCAAPGSKSFGAALDGAAEVRSFDLHKNKISLIRRGAEALGIDNLTSEAQDAKTASPEKTGVFPRVICDVPCSGFGVLAKKPDIRYKDVESAAGLPKIQREILERAATCVENGGILVYSTCTVLPAENEEPVNAFLADHPEFSLLPFSVGELHANGMLTLTPAEHGTDGFFLAKLQKGC